MLSLVLVVSNLGVAFSMHFCQGQVEMVKLNHLDNKVCKMKQQTSCCAVKKEANHCELPQKEEQDDDCCKDLAYAEDLQDQIGVDIFKISPIDFAILQTLFKVEILEFYQVKSVTSPLDFYVQSNAPPIYILHKQLVLYEA